MNTFGALFVGLVLGVFVGFIITIILYNKLQTRYEKRGHITINDNLYKLVKINVGEIVDEITDKGENK